MTGFHFISINRGLNSFVLPRLKSLRTRMAEKSTRTGQVSFGFKSWKNAGPKFVAAMKPAKLELALKVSTTLTELLVNNSRFMISICTSKRRCFGKC